MAEKDLNSNADCKTSSSSGVSSDVSRKSSIATIKQEHEESISISSIRGHTEIPDEISKGAANFLSDICLYPGHCDSSLSIVTKLYTALDWKVKLQNLRQQVSTDSPVALIHLELSNIFTNRLRDIEMNAPTDIKAILLVHKDWVDVLTKFNKNVFDDLEKLEGAVTDLQCAARAYWELSSSRRDFFTLIQLISQTLFKRKWNLNGVKFQTLQLSEVMGLDEKNPQDLRILHELSENDQSGS